MYEIRSEGYTRSYKIDGKQIISIAFYDETGIKVNTQLGWISKIAPYETDINPLVVDKSPVRKLKLNFPKMYADKTVAYANGTVKIGNCYNETGYILYLPYIPSEWTATFDYRVNGGTKSESVIHTNQEKGYTIRTYVREIPITENQEFIQKVRDLIKLAVYDDHAVSDLSIIKNQDKIKEAIKSF